MLYGNTNELSDIKSWADLRNSEQTAANLVTCSYFQRANFICKIRRKGVLSQAEKSKIVQRLHNKISILEIAKELHRDHRTIKILY